MVKRLVSTLLTVCLAVSLFSGCGSSSTSNNGNSASGSTSIKTGGIVKIGTPQSPTVLGYTPEVANNSFIQFLRTAYDSLISYNKDGSLAPDLALEWKTDAANAKLSFKLREGVKFSDGTDFNADAVKWNIEQYQAAGRVEVSNIAKVDCVDKNNVEITLKAWSSSALESIGFFVYYMSPTAFQKNGKDWMRVNSCGTGPFVVSSFEKGVSVKYKKNTNYWQKGKPYLDGVEFSVVTDPTTLENTFQSGEVDMVTYGALNLAKDLGKSDKYVIERNSNGTGVEYTGIIPNSNDPKSPFYKAEVRQAFCYAIDKDTIIKTLGYGYLSTTNQWASPKAVTYNKDVQGYPYNPEKAKQLLAQAGYANGFDTKFLCPTGFEDWATAIADQLTKVGIRTKVEVIDGAKMNDCMLKGWDGITFHFASIGPDLGLFMGRHLDPKGVYYAKGIQHPDDAVQLLNDVRTATDDKTKVSKEMELQKMIYDKYALFGLPLYVTFNTNIKYPYVKDDNFAQNHFALWSPENAWLNK